MKVQVRNKSGETVFGFEVDPAKPPPMIKSPQPERPTISLDWDRAIDDQRHLRRCPVCGCPDLFARKQLPQVTALVLVVLAAVIAIVLFGLGNLAWAIAVLVIVLAIDVGIFLFAKRVLECYRCHTAFRDMPIPRNHPRWDSNVAQRYRNAPHPITAEQEEAFRDRSRKR